ncbi:MAG: cyclic nucleotide-binding domain-containing protein [Bacteroidetes bacterium]|nr:cyclic nucleotide-binding domain-containing protein [Bacteroidota bacterium]
MAFDNLVGLFRQYVNFSEEELSSFTACLVRKEYKRNQIILEEGAVEKCLRFIDSGICRQYIFKNGDAYTVNLCLQHNFSSSYGSFTQQSPSRMGISAITDVVAWEISHQDLSELYNMSKEGERMGRLAAEELFAEAEDKVLDLLGKTALERYQELLDNDPKLLTKIPQKYIAEYLGMSPESLSRLKHAIV